MPADAEPLELITDLMAKAKAAGADAADALYVESVSISHAQRLGEIEKLERSESQDLGLRVFVGKQQAVVSSTDHSPTVLDELVARVVSMARSVPEDPHCGLAEPGLLARDIPEFDIFDPD